MSLIVRISVIFVAAIRQRRLRQGFYILPNGLVIIASGSSLRLRDPGTKGWKTPRSLHNRYLVLHLLSRLGASSRAFTLYPRTRGGPILDVVNYTESWGLTLCGKGLSVWVTYLIDWLVHLPGSVRHEMISHLVYYVPYQYVLRIQFMYLRSMISS